MTTLLLLVVLVLAALPGGRADMQMLGLGGGGGGGMVKGSSFNLDTKERITRVHGAGVKLDLELLEVATAGGSMLYTPTHVEFKKGLTRWMQTFSDGKLSLHHNDKTVLQLYAPDESPYYLLSMRGNAAFRDLILDKSLSNAVAFTLCIVDSVFDESLTQASCEVRAESVHLTVSQSMEGLAKSLLYVSEFVSSAQKNILADIVASVQESLVGPLQGEVRSELGNVRSEVTDLQRSMQGEREALAASLQASEASVNSTLAVLLGEVAEATTVTLATISNEAHNNLTKLEKAVFLHFVEFNKTYGQLLDVTVLQLQSNLTRLAEEVSGGLLELTEVTLPTLRASMMTAAQAELDTRFSRFGAESIANTTQLFDASMNFTRLVQGNVSLEKAARLQQEELLLSLRNDLDVGLVEASGQRDALRRALDEAVVSSNATTTALRGNLSSLFEDVGAIARNHSALLMLQNASVSELGEALVVGIKELRAEGSEQAEVCAKALGVAVEELQYQVMGNASALREGLQLADVKILQVEQNSSRSLAKSNSILANAVGEVNQSLSLLGTAVGQSMGRLENNFSLSIASVMQTLNETTTNTSTQARLELAHVSNRLSGLVEDTAGNLSGRLQELGGLMVNRVEGLGTALREEMTLQDARQLQSLEVVAREAEGNLTSRLGTLNMSLTSNLGALQQQIGEQIYDLNATSQHSMANLTSNVTTLFSRLQQLVVDLAREVYSPLEIDEMHPDSRPPEPQTGGSTADEGRFQRIDRAKKNKGKHVAAPRPVHFVNEELRVDVQDELLVLLEHEHGGSLSRSAVIEKGLHMLQQSLRTQETVFLEKLQATESNQSAALQYGLQMGEKLVENVTHVLSAELQGLNISLHQTREATGLGHSELRALLHRLNDTLSESLRHQYAVQQSEMAALDASLISNASVLTTSLSVLKEEILFNTSQNNAVLVKNINMTSDRLDSLKEQVENGLHNVSETFTSALNSSVHQLGDQISQNAAAFEVALHSNSTALSQRMHALNISSWEDHLETRRDAEMRWGVTNTSISQLASNLTALDIKQADNVQSLKQLAANNLTILRHHMLVAERSSNSTYELLRRNISTLSDQHASFVAEQSLRWTTSEKAQDVATQASLSRLVEVNESLTTQIASSSQALAAALVRMNSTQTQFVADSHAEALGLIESSTAKSTAALDVASKQTSKQFDSLAGDMNALRIAAHENLTQAEISWTRLIKESQEETTTQSSAALASSIGTLQAEALASQTLLQKEMSTLATNVQDSLRSSKETTSQQLELFAARVGGKINLTDHRVTQAEARLGGVETTVGDVQKEVQVIVNEAAHSRSDIARLAESQTEQAVRLWGIMNSTAESSATVSHLVTSAASTSQLLSVLDTSVRGLAVNCSLQSGLLQGALEGAAEARAVGERKYSATDAHLQSLDEKLSRNQEAIGSLQTQMGGSETSLPALQQDVMRVDGRVDVTSESLRSLQAAVVEAQEVAKKAQAETASLERRLSEVTSSTLPALSSKLVDVSTTSEKGLERMNAQHQHLVDKSLTAADEKAALMEKRLAIVELLVAQQDSRIDSLVRENEALKRSSAAQESVDDLRRLLQELQASMLQQSSKVLDLIVANLAGGKK